MHKYLQRNKEKEILQHLEIFPSILILGSRQCGKSTLVKNIFKYKKDFLYLDLQNYEDLNKLSEPNLFFEANRDKTICLDEIQETPHLFSYLRSIIDRNRTNGKFILLGSASQKIIQQTSETLAGRIGIIELTPFEINEIHNIKDFSIDKYWFRGGYPESFLSKNDENSIIWIENFIKTYIERDIPQLGFYSSTMQYRKLMTLLAHYHGQIINFSKIGEALNLTHPTIKKYIDLFEQTFIIRTLQPYYGNVKKRLIKTSKIYFRNTGILHKLIQIQDFNQLLSNPLLGASWEGIVIENICSNFQNQKISFYRNSNGDEIDLIIENSNFNIAIECKTSLSPNLTKGFWNSLEVIKPYKTYIVVPINDCYPIKDNIFVCGLSNIIDLLKKEFNQK